MCGGGLAAADEAQTLSEQDVIGTLRGSGSGVERVGRREEQFLVAFGCKDHAQDAGELSPTLRSLAHENGHANGGGQVAIAFQLTGDRDDPRVTPYEDGTYPTVAANPMSDRVPAVAFYPNMGPNARTDGASVEVAGTIAGANGGNKQAVAFQLTGDRDDPNVTAYEDGTYPTIAANPIAAPTVTAYNMDSRSPQSEEQQRAVASVHAAANVVRRLTPRECERLMGFPDDYTFVTYRGKPAADGPRYRALGNSMVTNVLLWIGQRIALVETLV